MKLCPKAKDSQWGGARIYVRFNACFLLLSWSMWPETPPAYSGVQRPPDRGLRFVQFNFVLPHNKQPILLTPTINTVTFTV